MFDETLIKAGRRVVIDIETNQVDWCGGQCLGFAVGSLDAERVDYYPVAHNGANVDAQQVRKFLKDVASSGAILVNHNAKFDLHFLANFGVEWKGPVECTQVMCALIDELRFTYNLRACGEWLGAPELKIVEEKGWKNELSSLPGDDRTLVEYAKQDVRAAGSLWKQAIRRIDADGLNRVWEVESQLTPVLMRMERRGLRVDEARLLEFKEVLEGELAAAEKACPINVRSGPQVLKWVVDHGGSGWPLTKKGGPSFPTSWLKDQKEEIALISKIRGYRTTRDSFVEPLINKHLHDGMVFPNYNQLKSESGNRGTIVRLSSSEPNIQQVPRRNKTLAMPLRRCFLPPEGMIWVKADWSQQEYRVLGHYSGHYDPNSAILAGYLQNPPKDIHQVVADMVGVERDPTAKRINLGMLYGMGEKTLAHELGMSVSEARPILRLYHERFPEASQFFSAAQSKGERDKYVKTILGRRLHFMFRGDARKAASRIISGTSADLMKLRLIQADKVTPIAMSIHDELDFYEDDPKVTAQVAEIMEQHEDLGLRCPMKVDIGRGADWGEATWA